jgi:hypothetical protein
MKKLLYISLVFVSAFVLNGCMDSEEELKSELLAGIDTGEGSQASAGSADFSNYISVGASFTAGYMDGALYNAGQRNSYPAIIAQQMLLAGGGDFAQPDINSQDGYNTVVSNPAAGVILGRFVLDPVAGAPVPIGPGDIASILTPYSGDLNNFGVPGARVVDLVSPLYGTPDLNGDGVPEGNPFYVRFASNPIGPGGSTIIGDAAAAGASFFSLQIGGNDALGWALTGGTAADVAEVPAAIAIPSSLTDVANFTGAMAGVVGALRAGGAKGVISTIGDLTLLPMFSLVPSHAIPMTDATTVAQLNGGFAGFNAALDGLVAFQIIPPEDGAQRKVNYALGANPILIEDDNLTSLKNGFDILLNAGAINATQRAQLEPFIIARPIKAGEITLVTASAKLGTEVFPGNPFVVWGVSFPLEDRFTLTEDELTRLGDRLSDFNDVIRAQAVAGEVGIVDLAAFSDQVVANGGVTIDGVTLGLSITPNDMFSTDFIHPNPRGMAIFANEYIKVINSEFGATLNEADVLNLPGVSLK